MTKKKPVIEQDDFDWIMELGLIIQHWASDKNISASKLVGFFIDKIIGICLHQECSKDKFKDILIQMAREFNRLKKLKESRMYVDE